jgi:hypothetical protein
VNRKEIIDWLLAGDVSIQYQTYRDLLGEDRIDLQKQISKKGWGARFLSNRQPDGHWGQKFYQPKWISTHYTLLDLRNLNIDPSISELKEMVERIAREEKGVDGGVNPAGSTRLSDVCINGMFMNYACYFGIEEPYLRPVVDFILSQQLKDGGFNCQLNRSGARHSSLHTTQSVLEGLIQYKYSGFVYRIQELEEAAEKSRAFILMHKFYLSDKTGMIINPAFLRLPYPSRWKYDVLRALDYFQYARVPFDDRMGAAIEFLKNKKNKDNTWNLHAKHPGKVHFEMEKAGKPSRWNTLRAMRVLKYYNS